MYRVKFTIGDNVYSEAFTDAMRFFYLQRCEAIPSSLGGDFAHAACHQTKARIYGTNDYIDVSGGWHDAGDYGRYVVATSKAVSDILLGYQANKAAMPKPEDPNLIHPGMKMKIPSLTGEYRKGTYDPKKEYEAYGK